MSSSEDDTRKIVEDFHRIASRGTKKCETGRWKIYMAITIVVFVVIVTVFYFYFIRAKQPRVPKKAETVSSTFEVRGMSNAAAEAVRNQNPTII